MGIDAGFDMVPPLTKSPEHRKLWKTFISQIRERYSTDPAVEFQENRIVWKKGEHPSLPYVGHKFMRFSAKVSGSLCGDVRKDLVEVAKIAMGIFGSRVFWWDEGRDEYGFYDWRDVYESFRSFDEPEEPENDIPEDEAAENSAPKDDTPEEETPKLFTIQTIPNKGRGLVATVDIPAGTRILAEEPLFTIKPTSSSVASLEGPISNLLKPLPEDQQSQYRLLHNNYKTKYPPLSGIFKTNALPCGAGSTIGGIYLTLCLLNHDCLPNTSHSWNNTLNRETIHATRLIKAGEELTISYIDGFTGLKLRQRKLKDSFGFTCTCKLCTLPPRKVKFSDRRRTEIEILDKSIAYNDGSSADSVSSLKDCKRLISLLVEEYQGCSQVWEARVYYDAFQICVGRGDLARARVMAERGYKLRVCSEGGDGDSVRRLKEFIEDPRKHSAYGLWSMDWKSGREDVPEGLEGEAFEKWLWRL